MLLNFFYNLFFPLVFLFFLPGLVVKLIRRPGRKKNYPERFAIFSREKKERLKALDHPVWMHAVSVGETNLALTALQAWKKIDPERRFVLSTTTTTAQEIARQKVPDGVEVIFCPIDFLPFVRKTFRLIRPSGLVVFETEIWPNLVRTAKKLGLPTGFESILFAITNIAIQAAINTFGTDTTAAWSAYGKLDAIFWMVSTAFGIAITTFVGQNYGAGRMDRVRRSTRVCLLIDLAVSGILVLFLIAAREILFRMFTTDPDVIRIGCNMLILIIPWYIVYVIIEVLAGALRGTGDVLVPMVITLTGVCVFRIIWLSVVMRVSPTIPAIIYSYPVTWILTAATFIIYYIRKYRKL